MVFCHLYPETSDPFGWADRQAAIFSIEQLVVGQDQFSF